ncbi:endonuclease domain-containing protein [Candidatus Uhrbacteria bacterium]|nr:endonuclease domain-containing protein [Candidatus Uhrbacteria bacterium]
MYNDLFNKPEKKRFRRELRNEPTIPEFLLWQEIKGSKLGYKFRRQQGIGPYVVDFYCPELKLVVEVDGDTHFEPVDIQRDNKRTTFLIDKGIQVLRVTNTDIHDALKDVVELIKQQLPNDHNHP